MNFEWQLYWPAWWKLWPSWITFPGDEYGPRERVYAFGPLQIRHFLWRQG